MFELIDKDVFADAVVRSFDVLHERYARDVGIELHKELCAMFDDAYDTRFLLVHRGTEQPAYPFLLRDYKYAEAARETHREKDQVGIEIVLIGR